MAIRGAAFERRKRTKSLGLPHREAGVFHSICWLSRYFSYLCTRNQTSKIWDRKKKTENKIIVIRDKQVILDRDVAELYGVETRRINEALKNNPDKFPDGYVIELTNSEKEYVVENFDHLKNMKYSHATTKAFTEKGLYMLATILKSPLATEVTIAIIETFSKVREVSRAIAKVNDDAEKGIMPKEEEQGKIQNLMGEVLADNLPLKMRKMAFSLNLGFLKVSVETTRGKD